MLAYSNKRFRTSFEKGREKVGEKGKETDRERQRQTETDRERQRQTETDRQTDSVQECVNLIQPPLPNMTIVTFSFT